MRPKNRSSGNVSLLGLGLGLGPGRLQLQWGEVTEAPRPALQQLLRSLGPKTSQVTAHGIDDPELCCISELHIAAAFDPDVDAPDQRVLAAVDFALTVQAALPSRDEL